MKRQRGRNRNNNNKNRNTNHNNHNRSLDSQGPDVKVRGTASTIYEKYTTLARDAKMSGHRVKAENLLQHAEHYLRLMNVQEAAKREAQELREKQEAERAAKRAENGEDDSENSRDNNRDGQRDTRRNNNRNTRNSRDDNRQADTDAPAELEVVTPQTDAPEGEAVKAKAAAKKSKSPQGRRR